MNILLNNIRYIIILMLISSLLAASPLAASAMPPSSILVVDYDLIQTSSVVAIDAKRQIEKYKKIFTEKTDADRIRLQNEEKELLKKLSAMPFDTQVVEKKKFEEKVAAVQKIVLDRREALVKAADDIGRKINNVLRSVLSSVMKQTNVSMLLSSNDLVYFDKSLDVTPEVMKEVNARLPAVIIEIPDNVK